MTGNQWVGVGALAGALTVMLGAFGAHALEQRLDAAELETWHTAVLYQGLHAPALVMYGLWRTSTARRAVAGSARVARGQAAGILLGAGIVLFSGSLYGYALGGPHALVFVTPLGGVALMLGWLVWAWEAFRSPAT